MHGYNLNQKKIFITGGSRGIGASIVKKCAEMGAQVVFTYATQEAQAQAVLESISTHSNIKHMALKMNVMDEVDIQSASEKTLDFFGGAIHGLVNNAGITKDQLLLRMKTEDFQNVLSANLMGPYLVTKAFSKSILKNETSVVNISSIIGSTGNAGQSNYAASKAGLEAFTRSLALELASRKVRVNAVAPGYITSDMTQALNESQLQSIQAKIPLGRAGNPEEISSVVGFLLCDLSSYLTGQTLHVNGGMYFN